jgi:hypothetical protein
MILADILSILLRLGELCFAAIVAGLTGNYLHAAQGQDSWDLGRFIYTEVVAGLSILLALIWLFPFSGSFIHWPADFVISVAWWVAFGLEVNWLGGNCGYVFDWNNIQVNGGDACPQLKADVAFTFLSAIFWLVSALLGIYWVHRRAAPVGTTTRRRWYRSRV